MGLSAPRRYRFALTLVLALGLVASLLVATLRVRKELGARRVEIAMDYTDFNALAQSYGYDEAQLLVALRRAGLTSLAVSEELGAAVDSGTDALLLSGAQLISQARLAPLGEPTLAALAKSGKLDARDLYLIVYNPSALPRYRRAIAMNLGPHALRTLRAADPTIFAFRSQLDYFNTLGLGLPVHPLALAGRLGLLVVPRVQNDERFGQPQIDEIFSSFNAGGKPTTVVFSGQRNEVLGFPDHLEDTADAFRQSGLNFGTIEIYDKTQLQKGNDGLAALIPDQTVRVQAISKTELDKLDFETVVARYLLGVRERNVRVVYLRPFPHPYNGMSPEGTNVELVRQIAQGLHARGFKLGRATAVQPIPGGPLLIVLASLAVPAIFMLLLEAFGVRRPRLVYVVVAADLALLALGYVSHHELLARKLLALAGGIMFAVMGVVAIPRSFTSPAPSDLRASLLAGLRTVCVATFFALCGALVVVGLVSVPLLMEEIDHFTGVKLVLTLPPIIAFALYIYTRRFGNEPPSPRASAEAPVRVYQILALLVLAAGAIVYVVRSGNQSDITPSSFELALRSNLTALLGVRPRFKEFAVGFPLMMLLPALQLAHRKALGWLFALGIAVGTADIVDTFCHLHTPLLVSLLRVFNGAVIGIILGAIAVIAYRSIWKVREKGA
jgi:hypothetical protein